MNSKETDTINIVSSVIGYGIYFPALIVYKQLKALGYEVNIYIIERFFDDKATQGFERTKDAFKKDVRLVEVASRIPVSYDKKLSDEKMKILFDEWIANKTTHFLCFSGLWLETLYTYKELNSSCVIDCCRVDSAVSATWSKLNELNKIVRNDLSFFNVHKKVINYILNIPEIRNLPYPERTRNVTMHGGGWDLGNFMTMTKQFTNNYHVNLIVNDLNITSGITDDISLYTNQQLWNPLYQNGFPPFGRIISDKTVTFKEYKNYHGILSVLSKTNAIVSKPGGMTLMDSLITEAPLIFLEPVGKNESNNQKLWENLQLGISLEKWQKTGNKDSFLQDMHDRIVKIKNITPCFVNTYVNLL